MSEAERFFAKVQHDPALGCWNWTAYKNEHGYGVFGVGTSSVLAHRWSWAHANKSQSELCVLHHCDNPSCVNPNHLFLGTRLDNAQDRDRKGRLGDRKGTSNGRAVLTPTQVQEIRSLRPFSTLDNLAAKFGVNRATIADIMSKRSWAHVPVEV
jgi:hypothetical protein